MKKLSKYLFLGIFSLALLSCGKKDEPKKPQNPTTGQEEPKKPENPQQGQQGQQGQEGQEKPQEEKPVITPLDFVSEFAVNKAGDGFVENHSIPKTSDLESKKCLVGFFTWDEAASNENKPVVAGVLGAKELFAEGKPLAKDWFLPNQSQWQSIFPYYKGAKIDFKRITYLDENVAEEAQIGLDESTKAIYSSDYDAVEEPEASNKFVVYAHRFKNTDWSSAWRYSWDEAKKSVKVECVALKGKSETIATIKTAEFFTKNKAVTRYFPCYGQIYNRANGNTDINLSGEKGYYWCQTSNFGIDVRAYVVLVNDKEAELNDEECHYGFPVRPFKKKI